MRVQLTSNSNEPANYELQVWQHDLDGDRPIYTRQVLLNGSGQAAHQEFWTYFLPQPIEKGLVDNSPRDLQRDLQVFLCKPDHKQAIKLPINFGIRNIDPYREAYTAHPRGTKLILEVSANGNLHSTLSSYKNEVGAKEDLEVVNVKAADLPDDPIGYEAVDAIVWLGGDPASISAGNLETYSALKDYVRFGGHLVICQSTSNWQEDLHFDDLMPVNVRGLDTKSNFEPLKSMASVRDYDPDIYRLASDNWGAAKGPFQMARATIRPGAVVDEWIDWKQDESNLDATPYLARRQYGLGQVTWVAQPLTSESAPGNATGWPYVWDKVMGWTSEGYVVSDKQDPTDPNQTPLKNRLKQFDPGSPLDLGYSLTNGLNLNSKANWLILLAIVFFVVYWLVAGPGTYAYLVTRRRQGWSWFFFGISAGVATLVTVLVVKLVLRGPPEIRHLSFVRIAPDQPAIVYSRFGLYIPRDGDQKISLDDISTDSVSYLSPFAEHPQQLGDVSEFPSPTEYYVPVRDLKSEGQPTLTVAYRSSLKKFQARWVGTLPAKINGSVKLDPEGRVHLDGILTNNTNADLTEVYLAFKLDRDSYGNDRDWIIYIPNWLKGISYDIQNDFGKGAMPVGSEDGEAHPGQGKIISDQLFRPYAINNSKANCWTNYWYNHFRRNSAADEMNNATDGDVGYAYPMLSLFDRLPAMSNTYENNGIGKDRLELFNRGARMMNASSSVADGQLVILATAKGPMPIPVEVDDTKTPGEGTVFYQFILPIDRGSVDGPTTKPSPTTKP